MIEPLHARMQVEGEGEPLLLVHGIGGPRMWSRALPGLAARHRVILPILPGFARGDGRVEPSEDRLLEFLERVREAAGVETWSVAGVSLGGRLVLSYAIRHRRRVRRIVTIAPAGAGRHLPALGVRPLGGVADAVLRSAMAWAPLSGWLFSQEFADPRGEAAAAGRAAWVEQLADPDVAANLRGLMLAVASEPPRWEALPALDLRALVLWGTRDRTCPPSGAPRLAALLPGARVAMLEGYRHLALLERPDFFVREILAFLADAEARGATGVCGAPGGEGR